MILSACQLREIKSKKEKNLIFLLLKDINKQVQAFLMELCNVGGQWYNNES